MLSLKQNKKDITISITTNFVEENSLNKRTPITTLITCADIPDLNATTLNLDTPVINNVKSYQCFYQFASKAIEDGYSFIAISVDNRSVQLDELKMPLLLVKDVFYCL